MSEKLVLRPNPPSSSPTAPSVPWTRDVTRSEVSVLPISLALHKHNIEALRIDKNGQNFFLEESRDRDLSQSLLCQWAYDEINST